MNTLFNIMNFIFLIVASISLFWCFKQYPELKDYVKNTLWKFFKAIKSIICGIVKLFYTELTGRTWPGEEVNYSVPLSIEELTFLVRKLEEHLYIAPTLNGYGTNSNGFFQVRIHAVAIRQNYSSLPPEQLRKLAVHIIQNFYLEVRGFSANVRILAISPQFLDFAISMTQNGLTYLKQLEQQIQEAQSSSSQEPLPPLTEKIPIPSEDESGHNDDFGL